MGRLGCVHAAFISYYRFICAHVHYSSLLQSAPWLSTCRPLCVIVPVLVFLRGMQMFFCVNSLLFLVVMVLHQGL